MKKWVDATRSRVSSFTLRNALRSTEPRDVETDTPGAATEDDETETASDLTEVKKPTEKEAVIEEGGEFMEPAFENADTNHDRMRRLASLEAENAQLKSTIDKMKNGILKGEGLSSERNKSQELSASDYDPLGATDYLEGVRATEEVQQLTEELESSKQRIVDLEQELSDAAALRNQLEEKDAKILELEGTVEDLQFQMQSIKEEFLRFRKQSESNAEEYEHRVESLSEQLHHQMKSSRSSFSKSVLESFPEQCDQPFGAPPHSMAASFGEDAHSTDIECSTGQNSVMEETEEYRKKVHQLTQTLWSMSMKQTDLQRRLAEAQDERDYMKSVVEDLQQQVDATSPEAVAQLRAIMQSMESEIKYLYEENAALKDKLQSQNLLETTHEDEDLDEDQDQVDLEPCDALRQFRRSPFLRGSTSHSRRDKRTEDGPSEVSEELVDCSFDIMGELANATADMEIGISMSYIQYAGLLAAIQKAIKQLEESKQSFSESTHSFRVLDKTLSKTLSISRYRVRAPGSEGEKRLDELLVLIKEKESGIKFMEQMITDLRIEIKGHQSLTLQQEVQLEYIKQQLSGSDKVISLTWEVESLKKALEESQRELQAQRDLNEQQQQELTIQWESKQQAVAENLSQNHRMSSFSQQLEHVVEAKDALEVEKQELEEALEQVRDESEAFKRDSHVKIDQLCQEIDALKTERNKERDQIKGIMTEEECLAMMEALKEMDDALSDARKSAEVQQNKHKTQAMEIVSRVRATWEKDVASLEKEKGEMEGQLREANEKLTVAESLRDRAEQEKLGVQEILSLTSEATSTEIANLQKRVADLKSQLEREIETGKEALTNSLSKTIEQQSIIASLEASLQQEQDQRDEQLHVLHTKLESCTEEKCNLETRVRSYKDVIAGLNRDIASREAQIKELNKIAEQNAIAFRSEKETTLALQGQLEDSKERLLQYTHEKTTLMEECGRLRALQDQINALTGDKSKMEAELNAMQLRNEECQKRHEATMMQLKETNSVNATLKHEQLRLEEKLMEEQQHTVTARSNWEAEIVKLSEMKTSRDRWPSSILTLVRNCEEAVLAEAMEEREVKLREMQLLVEQSAERERETEACSQEREIEFAEEARALQETIEKLQQEMKEREVILQQEISETANQRHKECNEAKEALTKLQQLYDALQEQSEQTIQQLQTEAEQKHIKLSEMQDKARELMKEKDAEIEALKKTTLPDSVAPATPDSTHASSEVVEKLQSDITFLRHLVFDLTSSLEESEHTHELRNKADQVLKDELSSYERSKKREGLDMDYVKNVLVHAFTKGTLPRSSPMYMVLARLFEFSPEDMETINKAVIPSESLPGSAAAPSSLFSWMRS